MSETPRSNTSRITIAVVIGVGILIVISIQMATRTATDVDEGKLPSEILPQSAPSNKTAGIESMLVTMDGVDPDAGITVERINLWKSYTNRAAGVAGSVAHGEKVRLIQRNGDGVLVESKSGARGWVTYYFIKEFK